MSRHPTSLILLAFAALAAVSALTAAAGAGADKGSAGSDWPTYLGPTGDGKSPETGLLKTWPEEGPRMIWQKKIGEGYSMPSVSRGRLFLFDRELGRARLTALDSRSGEKLWRTSYASDYEDIYGYSNGPRASPVVDGDQVYTYGAGGRLRAHRVTDGKLLWDVDTFDRFGVVQNFFGVGSTQVVEGELLIVPVGGSPKESPPISSGKVQSAGSALVAFDKRTGNVRWTAGDELASYSTPALATIAGRRRGFFFARGGLLVFDPASGGIDFHFPWRARVLASVNAAKPVVVGDLVFLSETYGPGSALLRVMRESYAVVWKDPPGRDKSLLAHWSTPIHHRGYLYGSSGRGSGDADLRCIELATGKVMWSQPGLFRSTLLYADDHFLVLTEYGDLVLIEADPKAYREVARVKLPEIKFPAWSPPILAHGLLYVRGKDRLVALELISRKGP